LHPHKVEPNRATIFFVEAAQPFENKLPAYSRPVKADGDFKRALVSHHASLS
jgi:hypothetical protein